MKQFLISIIPWSSSLSRPNLYCRNGLGPPELSPCYSDIHIFLNRSCLTSFFSDYQSPKTLSAALPAMTRTRKKSCARHPDAVDKANTRRPIIQECIIGLPDFMTSYRHAHLPVKRVSAAFRFHCLPSFHQSRCHHTHFRYQACESPAAHCCARGNSLRWWFLPA